MRLAIFLMALIMQLNNQALSDDLGQQEDERRRGRRKNRRNRNNSRHNRNNNNRNNRNNNSRNRNNSRRNNNHRTRSRNNNNNNNNNNRPKQQKLPFSPGDTFAVCIEERLTASCPRAVRNSPFRTVTGICNNLAKPTLGSTQTVLRRLLPADYIDGITIPRGFPAFGRSEPICPKNRRRPGVRQHPNEWTAFVDISQVYGSDEELFRELRVLDDESGELRVNNQQDNLMPIASIPKGFSACSVFKDVQGERTSQCRTLGGCSLVGDVRGDENIALHAMHTLWLREHNRIARVLRRLNRRWSGEKVFQTARKIVGAIWQQAVYEEFLPRLVKLKPYKRYNPNIDPSITQAFQAAAFRMGHSLVPNSFQQNNRNFDPMMDPVPLQEAFFNREKINFYGIEPTMFGLVGNQSNNVDNSFANGIARQLFVRPGEKFTYDLLALNIQRGRDHGLPTYPAYRKLCGLSEIKSFSDLRGVILPSAIRAFQRVYGSVNDIDLYAGGISEIHVSDLELGPTFSCLVGRQFESLRDGDRFFFKNPGVFTNSRLASIKRTKFSSVLCENLKGIVSIQPDALLVPSRINRRVSCSRIPRLDLRPFKE